MPIDRERLVRRHNPLVTEILPLSPLQVGNGRIAFSADITGLQSLARSYRCPLGTQSQWAWHSAGGAGRYSLRDIEMERFAGPASAGPPGDGLHGVSRPGAGPPYPTRPGTNPEAYHWLRQNPHRLQLAQIGLDYGRPGGQWLPQSPRQELDLWSGLLSSSFRVDGVPVDVETACHPERDELAFRIRSALIASGRLRVSIRFPSPRIASDRWEEAIGLEWGDPEGHATQIAGRTVGGMHLARRMDGEGYEVFLRWSGGRASRTGAHSFEISRGDGSPALELAAAFCPLSETMKPGSFPETAAASARHWAAFWSAGGAVELAESADPRAGELERRVVLSQYLTAVNSSGSLPPQETGLAYNSWFGKFHLEMHWWHCAHFALWGRSPLLGRSLSLYERILPAARELARSQGYAGARWPKQIGPGGRQSPSPIAPLLVWQQPQPIALAELCWRASPSRELLERYARVVFESAQFMSSFARREGGRFVLGPPLIPAQERHDPATTKNPPLELESWKQGLETALAWRARLGLPPVEEWRRIADHLAPLPVADGVYVACEGCADSLTAKNTDHPSMLGALGLLPGSLVDRQTMKRTLERVIAAWRWETAWGWDFPMAAMTAARLGGRAVDLLLMETPKNRYLPNGHNYQSPSLMAYLPGNGGLLAAVALMAAGSRPSATGFVQAGAGPAEAAGDRGRAVAPGGHDFPPRTHHEAPGFPTDGSWRVSWEGLQPLL